MSIIKMRSTRAKPERHLDDTTPYGPVIAIAFTFVGKPSAPVYLVMVDDIELDYNGSRGFAVGTADYGPISAEQGDEQGVNLAIGGKFRFQGDEEQPHHHHGFYVEDLCR